VADIKDPDKVPPDIATDVPVYISPDAVTEDPIRLSDDNIEPVFALPELARADPAVPVIDDPDEPTKVPPVMPEFVREDPDMDVIEDP